MIIVGAGMAGLLAARMLAHHRPIVVEAQPHLPNNHSAVLRFRGPTVGDVLGIPFRRVEVIRSTLPWRNPLADALAYSHKVTGTRRSDRSIMRETSSAERWIAPGDLIERMAEGVHIEFGTPYDFTSGSWPVISTIPMPNLMQLLDYPDLNEIEFSCRGGINVKARVHKCEAYASLYVPDPSFMFSRVSITGDELIAELPETNTAGLTAQDAMNAEKVVDQAAHLLGLPTDAIHDVEVRHQPYSKILPIDEGQRRTFIHWASTVQRRSFSLGRFATWRPGLLMDDLVRDVRVIESLINSPSMGYDAERLERERAKR